MVKCIEKEETYGCITLQIVVGCLQIVVNHNRKKEKSE